MKNNLLLLITLCLTAVNAPAGAQSPAPAAPPEPPGYPAGPVPPPPAYTAASADKAKEAQALIKRQVDLAKTQANLADLAMRDGQFQERLASIVTRASGLGEPQTTQIIRFGDTDPKTLAAAQEDMAIMARIFEKAVASQADDGPNRAMGIFVNVGGPGARNLLIQGYGAVFQLKVSFPLAGPVEKSAEEKPASPTNSTWEQTKQELYGARGPRIRAGAQPPPAIYDPKQVEALKNSLLEAMKNAANMRTLEDGEFVTVVVTSGSEGGMRVSWANTGGGAVVPQPGITVATPDQGTLTIPNALLASGGYQPGNVFPAGSTLTMRARKADIDAFARGKLNLEEFRKKAAMTVY